MQRAFVRGCLSVLAFLPPCSLVTSAAEPALNSAVVEGPLAQEELEAVPATPLPVPSAGSGQATLGVQLLPLSGLGDPYRSPVAEGALIGSILAGSPADRAGLPLGGVIVAIDGRRVSSPADAARIIRSSAPDQQVEVKYYDGNRLFRKKVQLVPAAVAESFLPPQFPVESPPPPIPVQPPQRRAVREGIGRLLEQLAAPPQPSAAMPVLPPADEESMDELRLQLGELQRQVAELQARVTELENKLAERPPR